MNFQLNLRNKILSASLITILFTGMVAIIAKVMMEQVIEVEKLHAAVDRLEIIALDMRRSEKNFLMDEVYDKDFHKSSDSLDIKEHDQAYLNFQSLIKELRTKPLVAKYGLQSAIEELNRHALAYQSYFEQLKAKLQSRGISGYGLTGQLEQLETELGVASSLQQAQLVGLRQLLFLQRHQEHQELIANRFDSWFKNLEKTKVSEAKRYQLMDKLQRYQQRIQEYHQLNQEIGTHGKGLLAKMETEAQLLIPLLEKSEKFVGQKAEEIMAQTAVWITSLLILAITFGLGAAFIIANALTKRLIELQKNAEKIAAGDLNTEVKISANDEVGHLAAAFRVMVHALRHRTDEIEAQSWLKSQLAEIVGELQRAQDLQVLGDQLLELLIPRINAQMAALYARKDMHQSGIMELIATYAYQDRHTLQPHIKIGEGICGQALKERKTITLHNIPEHYIPIQSALGQKQPHRLTLKPIIFDDQVIALLEVAGFHEPTAQESELLELTCQNLATIIANIISREQTVQLLHETQAQNEEIQNQAEELEEINNQLERQADELRRSQEEAELRNNELEKAESELKQRAAELMRSSQYKSEFLANMSHELRTPLNSILILSKLLEQNSGQNLNPQQIKHAHTIYSAGNDLLNLINEILDLSKIEAGQMKIQSQKFKLSKIPETLTNLFEAPIAEKNVGFEIEVAPDAPKYLQTDLDRVMQVLKNFMSNAIKYTDQGSIKVKISPTPQDQLSFAVSDSGIGIPQDKHELIFQAFQQVDGTTTRKYNGTGLGLSICVKIADLLGGSIDLESKPGEGSTFRLVIPPVLALTNTDSETKDVQHRTPPQVSKTEISSTRLAQMDKIVDDTASIAIDDKVLLIAEDDPNFAETLMGEARKWGYKVLIADTGTTAVRLAEKYIPSAIILDIQLPVMDGWVVLQTLKSNPETRHIPVHIISGLDDSNFGLKLGALNYSTKPITAERLDDAFTEFETFSGKTVKNLLVIEDNDHERQAIIDLIASDDIQIQSAACGKEAMEIIATNDFDCIIIDLKLPDFSGSELLKKIHESKDMRRIPIIIYTGRDMDETEEADLGNLSDSIIIKSVNSPARLVEETTIFLHRIKDKIGQKQAELLGALSQPESTFQNKTVLLVDDDIRNVYAIASALENKGLKVITAGNGEAALEILDQEQEAIDIVLLDMMMPVMDGYETAREIRKRSQFNELPIIALTAKAMKGDRSQCIEAGASDYLSKPIDLQQLVSLIRVWLSARRSPLRSQNAS